MTKFKDAENHVSLSVRPILRQVTTYIVFTSASWDSAFRGCFLYAVTGLKYLVHSIFGVKTL